MTGDAIINNRKKKLIPSYELEVKGTWKGGATMHSVSCSNFQNSGCYNKEQGLSGNCKLLTLTWSGPLAGSTKDGSSAEGTFTLPYIADENVDEDPELKAAVLSDNKTAQQLRELFLSRGKQVHLRQAAHKSFQQLSMRPLVGPMGWPLLHTACRDSAPFDSTVFVCGSSANRNPRPARCEIDRMSYARLRGVQNIHQCDEVHDL